MSPLLRALLAIGVVLAVGCTGEASSDDPATRVPSESAATTTFEGPASTSAAPAVGPGSSSAPSSTSSLPVLDVVPSTTAAPDGEADQIGRDHALLEGVAWEHSGIPRVCRPIDPEQRVRCTQVVHSAQGVPISYDPTTRTLTRHVREAGDFASAVLPESYGNDVQLVAAGPDQVVYLNLVKEFGYEGSADLVAIALAPGDAGREIERLDGGGNPGTDSDFVVTPEGLVATDWYGQGQRPAADRPLVMAWVDRDRGDADSPAPDADPYPNGVRSITIDAYERTVTVNGRSWQLTGRVADFAPTGMPTIVGTFDGGFVARYDKLFDDYQSLVLRGWPDGSVDEWVLPPPPEWQEGPAWQEWPAWPIVPEPMGTVLIATGDTYVRAVPFESRPTAWDGQLVINVENGQADVGAFNAYLGTLDWAAPQPPWDIDPVAFANALAGPLPSLAGLRTISYVRHDTHQEVVIVTDERLLDDSVYGTRLTVSIGSDLHSVDAVGWSSSCQTGRGHQDYRTANCA